MQLYTEPPTTKVARAPEPFAPRELGALGLRWILDRVVITPATNTGVSIACLSNLLCLHRVPYLYSDVPLPLSSSL